ncbi:MAG: hypothetical protein ABFD92_06530 [Planctomycetaceae bacterium]|nr:hypothetical protein [Planctomycetaceae bacterium]
MECGAMMAHGGEGAMLEAIFLRILSIVAAIVLLSFILVKYGPYKRRRPLKTVWPELQPGSKILRIVGKAADLISRLEVFQQNQQHDIVVSQVPQLERAIADLQEASAVIANDGSFSAATAAELIRRIDHVCRRAQVVLDEAGPIHTLQGCDGDGMSK